MTHDEIQYWKTWCRKPKPTPPKKSKLLEKQKEALDREIDELSRADGPILADETQI